MLLRLSSALLTAALVLSPLVSYRVTLKGEVLTKYAQAARRVGAVELPEVVSISLVDADSNEVIPEFDPIENGDEIDLALLPSENINLRANIANGSARSVRFQIVRQRQAVTDNVRPFSLRDRSGDYGGYPFVKGAHTIKVTPYANTSARGVRTSTYQVSFKIKKSRKNTPPTASPTPSASQSPTPSPSLIPTPPPSASPTPVPTVNPSASPSLVPSPSPTPSGTPRPSPTVPLTVIPRKGEWEYNMQVFGNMHCQMLIDPAASFDLKLLATYYDAEFVFFNIAQHLNNGFFNTCAERAEAVYRDQYAAVYSGFLPGYWNFTHGLRESYLRTNDATSRAVAIQIAENAAFARDSTQLSETMLADASRETAYAIHAYLNAEDLGQPRRARLATLVNHALGHLDQWYVSRTAPYVRPFMVGLTAHALISYYEKTGDSRIVPALQQAADAMFAELWVESSLAFRYTDRLINPGDLDPAPDLNMLIAPLYGFLFHETGDSKYLVQGDKIFEGGVLGAYLYNGKQFNQSYRWSFDYVRYRTIAPKR